MPGSVDLLDVNLWLALVVEAHAHHSRARTFWESGAAPRAAFCRVTHLAFPRHLTNKTIMGSQVLTPAGAWAKAEELLALPEVQFLPEPPHLNEHLAKLCDLGRNSPNLWTDAYLAAFAGAAGLRLVTFDRGFAGFSGLKLLVLQPAR